MKPIIKLFYDLFSRFTLYFLILVLGVFFQAVTNALVVVSIAPITDLLLGRMGEEASSITAFFESIVSNYGYDFNLLLVCIFFGSISLFNGVLAIFVNYYLLKIKYAVLTYLLTDTMTQFFRSSYSFFTQGQMGTLLNSFQQEMTKVGDAFGRIAKVFADLIQGLIFLLLPLSLSPEFTLLFIFTTILLSAPIWLMGGIATRLGKKNTDTANEYTGVLHDLLTGAKLILSYGVQKNSVDTYEQFFKRHAKVSIPFQTLRTGVSLFFVPVGTISALLVIYIAFNQGMPFSEVAMVLFAFTRILPIAGSLIESKTTIQGFIPAYLQIQRLKKEASDVEEVVGDKKFSKFKESIRFKNVKFSYPGKENTLNRINLTIEKGNLTALVGQSGSGKTTAIDLMLGLYNPQSGNIVVDGTRLSEYNLNSYRSRIGYVPQDPFLFNTSLRENLLWSNPGASEKEMWEACRLANADSFIMDLPEKLDAVFGDRGVRLSGGQRQRIALARAIIRKPEILFLDEATSSLDSNSELLIQESMENLAGEMTIICIAHRLSTIQSADKIYHLEGGRIIEEGTFEELINSEESSFRKIAKLQGII